MHGDSNTTAKEPFLLGQMDQEPFFWLKILALGPQPKLAKTELWLRLYVLYFSQR